ncbi:MAG: putative tRNA-dihydrouridine synthase [Turneriella sp.]|nr:putative tRNA-dihydrouridine synthase [Turneriella sp.]
MGSAYSITEFVSTEHLFRSNPKAIALFRYEEIERPLVFQVFGKDPDIVAKGINRVLHLNPDGIDLNMGCSVRTVSASGSGAGLLKTPEVARTIIRRLTAETNLPISAKIRLGWDSGNLNYKEISAMLESEGVWSIAVHGRTRQMGYSGRANWDAIGEIAEACRIPIFGNGDVTSYEEAHQKIQDYGVYGVFIGRGAIGNPWLFAGKNREFLNYAERLPTILEHVQSMAKFYGDQAAAILMRKHLTQYLHGLPEWNRMRKVVHHLTSARLLEEYLSTGMAVPT